MTRTARELRMSLTPALNAAPRHSTSAPLSDDADGVVNAADAAQHVVGHAQVDVGRELDELGVEVELARLPREVVRGRRGCSGRRGRCPGRNAWKPNGFVAAASMTSQMSMPISWHELASSLTSAMLTAR